MPERTEAQKRAQKKYMSSFVEIKVRMTPEKRSAIQAHAKAMGESATVFINRAIDQTMSQEAVESHTREFDALHSEIQEAEKTASEGRREGGA